MNCPKCNEQMVTARASSFGSEYYYCRGCKKELAELMVRPVSTGSPFQTFETMITKSDSASGILVVPVKLNAHVVSFWVTQAPRLHVSDWIPTDEPKLDDNFCGVDRSLDTTYLSGLRLTQSMGDTLETTLEKGAAKVNFVGGRPDICLLPTKQFKKLTQEFATASHLVTPYGMLEIREEPGLINVGYLLTLQSWVLDINLYCNRPQHNLVIKFNDID